MKSVLLIILIVVSFFLRFDIPVYCGEQRDELMVADFNTGEKPNNLGADYGTWDYDPNDETQGCQMSFEPSGATVAPNGSSLRLDYDVQSSNPAFNGFWMKLNSLDISDYNRLRFLIKGGPRCTSQLKCELKNELGERAIYFVKNITTEWQEVLIAFKDTRAISAWTKMTEFTIVFSDRIATYKEGTLYIDDISFLRVNEQ